MVRTSIINSVSDADLATRIGIAFATRPRTTWHDIQVSVRDGIVTLRGEMPTQYDRQLVVAVTRHVAGVFGIIDQLAVVEPTARSSQLPRAFAATQPNDRRSSWDLRRIGGRNGRHLLRAGFAAFAIVVITLSGCGGGDSGRVPVHPVTGAIQFRGQPTAGAFVSLHPKDGAPNSAPSPRATVGPDGRFSLSTYDTQDGAPEGDYVLTVQWYKSVRQGNDLVGGPNVLPVKYANAKTSDLQIRIAAGENQLKPIQLR